MTTQDRIEFHLVGEFKKRKLSEIKRDELQTFLDQKAAKLSFSTVDHLRWDLMSIFKMAVSEGCIRRNPASLLFTPREAKRPEHPVIGGMRPGEIFALRRGGVRATCAEVKERPAL